MLLVHLEEALSGGHVYGFLTFPKSPLQLFIAARGNTCYHARPDSMQFPHAASICHCGPLLFQFFADDPGYDAGLDRLAIHLAPAVDTDQEEPAQEDRQ